ncbi:phosphoenolpyruvate carboxylase [Catenovulum sp. 2E275]|uniref:phosphoenolpyruvate carboxylase n=1 Tax=Catenovulum sp. 2E275 TaxID=2980497 RepID=UPI0021CE851C|nr:phosphoenolpyruvate carboxylase [Catenovulum sp. 2E275]MCU4677064.1 phosphoenolpyruvate carboxylase [Catenovulum sp. 2E275]
MKDNFTQAGTKFLRALSRHSDLIMQTYLTGTVDESIYSPQVLDNLQTLGIIWRPDAESDLRLRRVVRALLEEGLSDERNRQIDANVGGALNKVMTLVAHYKEASHKHRFAEAAAHLADLTELTYALIDSLKQGVRALWAKIHKEFGYVASIDAKIRENQLAQSQVSEILAQLELFEFDKLAIEAGSNRDLRRLLVVTLQSNFAAITQELSLAQARLTELLGRFREFQGRTRLLKGFVLHLEQNPAYQPAQYTQHSKVPALFNLADSVIKPAAVDVNNPQHEVELSQIVGRLKAIYHLKTHPPANASQHIQVEKMAEVELDENKVKQQVEAYFCQVIDSGERQSALEYHQTEQLAFDKEVWLYQVIGEYEALPDTEKSYFEIEKSLTDHPIYSGNKIIEDVELWFS